LSALERGRHALRSGKSVALYADAVARPRSTVQHEVDAATVANAVSAGGHDRFAHLVEIRSAKPWLWQSLFALTEDWKRQEVREKVSALKEAPEQKWGFAWDRIAEHVVADSLSLGDVQGMIDTCTRYVEQFGEEKIEAMLTGKNVSTPSQLTMAL
jgi:hypothetical protein